ESRKSRDILNVFLNLAEKQKVNFFKNFPVGSVEKVQDGFIIQKGYSANKESHVQQHGEQEIRCKKLVIATGGKSYPSTGSNGDGYRFAETLGHKIVPPRPCLTSIEVKNYGFADCSGIAIENVTISSVSNKNLKNMNCSSILFTHKGLSGPGILDSSRYFSVGEKLKFNWLHSANITAADFEKRLIEKLPNSGNRPLANVLVSVTSSSSGTRYLYHAGLVNNGIPCITLREKQGYAKRVNDKTLSTCKIPERFIHVMLREIGVSADQRACTVDKDTRKKIVTAFTAFEMQISAITGFAEAMCTAGGVSIKEVDRNRLESRLVPNLYFCGEVLDIDGDSGGYNIQFAFSSGILAADAALDVRC
ncbi:MAG: NAD(P)/FAD-dependent oxidoreductase, partial [Thermoguttaceae bacterium]